MKTTHAPNPPHGDSEQIFSIRNGETCVRTARQRRDEEADTRLRSAAPDLLAALEDMLRCNHELGAISRPVANAARAAIRKAKEGK